MAALSCLSLASGQSTDPCADRPSNRETRECYATEQVRVGAQADALVSQIAAGLREDAKDASNGTPVNDLLQKSAFTLVESEKGWKNFREQYCRSVESSWTSGSGAGTAYEACMFNLARQRVRTLRSDFDNYVQHDRTGKTKK